MPEVSTKEQRFVLYPPRIGCAEVQRLKDHFKECGYKCFIAKRDGEYSPRKGDLIIGWGYSKPPVWKDQAERSKVLWLNHHSLILNAVQKMLSFELMDEAGIPIPAWTTQRARAQIWSNAGITILARSSENGCKGEGIVVSTPGDKLPNALFYTKFIPSTKEYRVYAVNGTVIDVLEKRRINGVEANEYVRGSEESGWQFCRQNVFLDRQSQDIACAAVAALGLDFGGVDLLVSGGKGIVLEVNTAPDVFGSGLDRFVNAFVNAAKAA